VNAQSQDAARLGVKAGAACFLIKSTGFLNDEQPLWYEETLYRASEYELRNRISGLTSIGAARGRLVAAS
jgi:DNA-binding GntR family transcriptional regulator